MKDNGVKEVKISILAQGAYASIYSVSPDSHLDVKLPCHGPAHKSLDQAAGDFEAKAQQYQRYATICREAAEMERERTQLTGQEVPR